MDKYKSIFIVGVKGVAMAGIAVILKKMGKVVRGSDVAEEFITDSLLKKHNIEVLTGFDPGAVADSDILIFSAAHNGRENPQVLAAQKLHVATMSQAEFLGVLTREFGTTIAVAGTHGKTTTSSFLSHALIQLEVNPSYLVGTSNFGDYDGADFSGKEYFVIEADEYAVSPPADKTPKFHLLKPDIILATNVDFDHPDVFRNLEEVQDAFRKFLAVGKTLVACCDDIPLMEVVSRVPDRHVKTFGFRDDAYAHIHTPEVIPQGTRFKLLHEGKSDTYFIPLFGQKNVSNAAGVIVTLLELGFSSEQIAKAIKTFKGPKRRFELAWSDKKTYLFDDYAHHPAEIEATLDAARSAFPGKRVGIIFQPHTYSRTQALLREFAQALSKADYAIVAPIFASAREKDGSVSASDITGPHIEAVGSKEEILPLLASNFKKGDILFTMGAGDIYELKNGIIEALNHDFSRPKKRR